MESNIKACEHVLRGNTAAYVSPVIARCHFKSIPHQKHAFSDALSFSNTDPRGRIIAECLPTLDTFPAGVLRPPCFPCNLQPFSLSIAFLTSDRYSAANESFRSFSWRTGVQLYLTGRSERMVVGGESLDFRLRCWDRSTGVHGSADLFGDTYMLLRGWHGSVC